MRSILNVKEIRFQLFLFQESRRVSIYFDNMQLNISQVMVPQQRETPQQQHHIMRMLGMQTVRDWLPNHETIESVIHWHKIDSIVCNCRSQRNPDDRRILCLMIKSMKRQLVQGILQQNTLFQWLRDLPAISQPFSYLFLSKTTAWRTRHVGNRERDGALSWREYIG